MQPIKSNLLLGRNILYFLDSGYEKKVIGELVLPDCDETEQNKIGQYLINCYEHSYKGAYGSYKLQRIYYGNCDSLANQILLALNDYEHGVVQCTMTNLRTANEARHIEWSKGNEIPLSFRGLELGGECGEALNVLKKIEREKMGLVGSRASLQDMADELADVVICCDLIAMDLGINLNQAVATKFNKTSDKYKLTTKMRF